jgi:hypothetical protein
MDNPTDTTNQESGPQEGPDDKLKSRLANLLINRVALSECLNVIKDACISRAGAIVDEADSTQRAQIEKDVNEFENPPTADSTAPSVEGAADSEAAVSDPPPPPSVLPELSPAEESGPVN